MADTLGNRYVKFGNAGILIQPHSANKLEPTIIQIGAATFTMKNEVVGSNTGKGRVAAAYHGTQMAELSITARSSSPVVIGNLAGALINETAAKTGWSIVVENMKGTTKTATGLQLASGATPKYAGMFALQFAATGTPSLATATIRAIGFWNSDMEGNAPVTAANLGIELTTEQHYLAGDKVEFQIYSPQVGGGQILYGGIKAGVCEVFLVRDSNSSRTDESQANNLYIPRCVSMGDIPLNMTPNELAENTFTFMVLYDATLAMLDGNLGGYAIENYAFPNLTAQT